jgi:hypothetical protein
MHTQPYRVRGRAPATALLLVLGLGAPLALAGCGREATGPAGATTPAFDWMNNPDNGNVRFARFELDYFMSWTDPSKGLRALHTTYPLSPDCGPQDVLDPIDAQNIGLSTDPKIRANWQGPVWIVIRDVTQPGTCFGNKLVAQGPGRLHYTDNDFSGPGPDAANTNAFGWMGAGEVTTPDGVRLHYNGSLRYTARFLGGDPTDPASYDIRIRTSSVNLK